MSQPRVGSAFWHGNHWDIQITLPDGQRGNRACCAVGVSEKDARKEAHDLTLQAIAEGWTRQPSPDPHGPTGNTFDVYAEQWLATRRDPKDASAHLRFHILPLLMNHVTTAITKEDVERVVARLDERVRAGELAWKTAQNVWTTMSKLFDDATNAKRLELRVLTHNPAEGVRGPDRGEDRQASYLFPNEASRFLACVKVPMHWKIASAVAMYSGLRRGELVVLRVADVVLEGGYINVSKAADRTKKLGEVKSTKGKRARRVPIEPSLLPLLEQLTRGRAGDELLVRMPCHDNLAGNLRKQLTRAGVTRAELHADDEQRRPLNFHDLRHTFATWLALSGASQLTIQTRLGHADAQQLQRYVTEAEAVGHGDIGKPFGPLPASLVGTTEAQSLPKRSQIAQPHETRGDRRGSNPRQLEPQSSALPS